jgi:hypothetical protein
MSMTSEFALSSWALLFKSDLQGQYSELTRAIDSCPYRKPRCI